MLKAGRTVNIGDHIPYVICIEPQGTVAPLAAAEGASTPQQQQAPAEGGAMATPDGVLQPAQTPLSAGGAPPSTGPSPPGGSAVTPDKANSAAAAHSHGGSSGGVGIAARAYHPEEVRKSGGRLHLDIEWYLSTQVLPPVARE
jgi:hypothetical protein